MKKFIFVLVAFCILASYAFAQPAVTDTTQASTDAIESFTLKGGIIDNKCAGTQTREELAEFVKTHTKACALQPSCVASGYSIFANGQLYKFDKDSNAKIKEFLKKEDSKLKVEVTAMKVGEELSLISIENHK